MRTNATDKNKVEEYARALLDSAKDEGRGPLDLQQMRHALKFSPEVFQTLARMEDESDLALIDQVYQDLKDMLDNEDETVTVDVTTAVPMDAELRAKVMEKCKADLKAPIFLVEHVEPKILGGIIFEVRGHRRDASVKAQLVNVRKTLAATFMGIDEI